MNELEFFSSPLIEDSEKFTAIFKKTDSILNNYYSPEFNQNINLIQISNSITYHQKEIDKEINHTERCFTNLSHNFEDISSWIHSQSSQHLSFDTDTNNEQEFPENEVNEKNSLPSLKNKAKHINFLKSSFLKCLRDSLETKETAESSRYLCIYNSSLKKYQNRREIYENINKNLDTCNRNLMKTKNTYQNLNNQAEELNLITKSFQGAQNHQIIQNFKRFKLLQKLANSNISKLKSQYVQFVEDRDIFKNSKVSQARLERNIQKHQDKETNQEFEYQNKIRALNDELDNFSEKENEQLKEMLTDLEKSRNVLMNNEADLTSKLLNDTGFENENNTHNIDCALEKNIKNFKKAIKQSIQSNQSDSVFKCLQNNLTLQESIITSELDKKIEQIEAILSMRLNRLCNESKILISKYSSEASHQNILLSTLKNRFEQSLVTKFIEQSSISEDLETFEQLLIDIAEQFDFNSDRTQIKEFHKDIERIDNFISKAAKMICMIKTFIENIKNKSYFQYLSYIRTQSTIHRSSSLPLFRLPFKFEYEENFESSSIQSFQSPTQSCKSFLSLSSNSKDSAFSKSSDHSQHSRKRKHYSGISPSSSHNSHLSLSSYISSKSHHSIQTINSSHKKDKFKESDVSDSLDKSIDENVLNAKKQHISNTDNSKTTEINHSPKNPKKKVKTNKISDITSNVPNYEDNDQEIPNEKILSSLDSESVSNETKSSHNDPSLRISTQTSEHSLHESEDNLSFDNDYSESLSQEDSEDSLSYSDRSLKEEREGFSKGSNDININKKQNKVNQNKVKQNKMKQNKMKQNKVMQNKVTQNKVRNNDVSSKIYEKDSEEEYVEEEREDKILTKENHKKNLTPKKRRVDKQKVFMPKKLKQSLSKNSINESKTKSKENILVPKQEISQIIFTQSDQSSFNNINDENTNEFGMKEQYPQNLPSYQKESQDNTGKWQFKNKRRPLFEEASKNHQFKQQQIFDQISDKTGKTNFDNQNDECEDSFSLPLFNIYDNNKIHDPIPKTEQNSPRPIINYNTMKERQLQLLKSLAFQKDIKDFELQGLPYDITNFNIEYLRMILVNQQTNDFSLAFQYQILNKAAMELANLVENETKKFEVTDNQLFLKSLDDRKDMITSDFYSFTQSKGTSQLVTIKPLITKPTKKKNIKKHIYSNYVQKLDFFDFQ